MLSRTALSVLLVVVFSLTSEANFPPGPEWETLRVTWSFTSLWGFKKLPRTELDAVSEGWTKLPGNCSGQLFLGRRYIWGNDPGVVLIFDKNGFIAGIQNGIPKKFVIDSDSKFRYQGTPSYQLDTVHNEPTYLITAYFVDPRIICTTGRTLDEFNDQGTGTGLYIQNSEAPLQNLVRIPLYEKEILADANWVKGKCFRTMGMHYWYRVTPDFKCEDYFPVAQMYNNGKLSAFQFFNAGNYHFSQRFEHAPEFILSLLMPTPLPVCVKEEYKITGGFTSMHVFFNVEPQNLAC